VGWRLLFGRYARAPQLNAGTTLRRGKLEKLAYSTTAWRLACGCCPAGVVRTSQPADITVAFQPAFAMALTSSSGAGLKYAPAHYPHQRWRALRSFVLFRRKNGAWCFVYMALRDFAVLIPRLLRAWARTSWPRHYYYGGCVWRRLQLDKLILCLWFLWSKAMLAHLLSLWDSVQTCCLLAAKHLEEKKGWRHVATQRKRINPRMRTDGAGGF
jgi:hypothetical protein